MHQKQSIKFMEELKKTTQIENTPFTIVSMDSKHFGTLGAYKLTSEMETPEEVKKELEKINWENISKVMYAMTDSVRRQIEARYQFTEKLSKTVNN
ncbi:hypothetical protein [Microviridae sp.]|nr:hypothetical protein [Microviridae sp.]UOF82361.1 hypothetical protein [Microviridae sp.]